MPRDEPSDLDVAARLAAIRQRLDTLMRDAREIRAALTKLSERDPFALLRETLKERARRTRPLE